MYHHYHTRRLPASQPQCPLAISYHHACIPSLQSFSLVYLHLTTSKQTPVQARTRTSWRATQRCAMCTQLSVYDYLKDSFLSSFASAGVPARRVDLVGLYRSWTLLSARPTNFPSTHSLSVVTLCTPHSTAHHPIALRDELDRLPILLTPLSFYFILQHYCTKSFPRFPHQFICGPSAASLAPILFSVSNRLLSFHLFRPFHSVSSMLHHLPLSPIQLSSHLRTSLKGYSLSRASRTVLHYAVAFQSIRYYQRDLIQDRSYSCVNLQDPGRIGGSRSSHNGLGPSIQPLRAVR